MENRKMISFDAGIVGLSYEKYKRIDVLDLLSIESLSITEENGNDIRNVIFKDGGSFKVLVRPDGCIGSVEISNVAGSYDEGDTVLSLGPRSLLD